MIKLVIFDLDGTLLNTIDDITDSLNLALKDLGLNEVTVEECKYMVGSGVDNLIRKALKESIHFEKLKSKYLGYYEQLQRNKTKPYDYIPEVVKAIKDKGYKIAILSNKPHQDTLRVVDYYFEKTLFDIVLGKKANNRIKPDIDGCLEILNTLNVSKTEVLYIGDTNVDMETAYNAGFKSVAVTWGFRKPYELENYHYLIDDPRQLLEILGV